MKNLLIILLVLPFALGSCQDKYSDLEPGIYAEFQTNNGTFVAKLYDDATPLTVANFVALAEGTNEMVDSTYKGKKYYDGLVFHRVIKDFMIQGGCPLGNGTGSPGYRFPDEFVDSLKHDRKGILSMANSGPGTNGSQFFVTLKETPWLDGKHTVFGEVVVGQEIVDAIGLVATSKPGDKPVETVVMEQVNIIKRGNATVPSFQEQMEIAEREAQEKRDRILKVAMDTKSQLEADIAQGEELESGVKIFWNRRTKGIKPVEGSTIMINYAGYFDNGLMFDTSYLEVAEKYDAVDPQRLAYNQYGPSQTTYSPEAQMIPGLREAMLMMNAGEMITVYIPSHLGYGPTGYPPVIPPNQDLYFQLELVDLVQD
ncbi:peptidylprolyl isomerase [Aureitalea marina]|uniref:peptidylprolyl isomerase n=1 Tax=Aureitalea marina TaxID=930804 RepID=A0A2S7KPZ7_9FLAO|nr:peptidylprolyl isomerase [Aureitalea marina]PQB04702.1 peptidylprolyl isomerase [Aureitalea marina]